MPEGDISRSLGELNQTVQNYNTVLANANLASSQRDWATQEAEKAFERSLSMWNLTNWYNSPKKQVSRLLQAGLNPLYYGLDGSSANAFEASQPSPFQRASVGDQPNPILTGLQAELAQAQISNVQADTAKKNNENISETVSREKMQVEMGKLKEEIAAIAMNRDLTSEQLENLKIVNRYADQFQQASVRKLNAESENMEAAAKRIRELLPMEKVLQIKTAKQLDATVKKLAAECKVLATQYKLNAADLYFYGLNHMSQGWMGTGLSLQNIFRGYIDYMDKLEGNKPKSLTDPEAEDEFPFEPWELEGFNQD